MAIPPPPFAKTNEWTKSPHHLNSIPAYSHLPLHPRIVSEHLKTELSITRLNDIYPHLWIAGRKGHIRPLHKQLMLGREIAITEDPTMHLIWFENKIFLKPIPEALLHWDFWQKFVSVDPSASNNGKPEIQKGPYHEMACGFLLSYTRLVAHDSDYRIAVSQNLIPDMGFHIWCLLAQNIRDTCSKPDFATEKRWKYGELRLSRLNWIYKLTLRGYSYFYIFTEYSPYFGKNFQLLLLCFAYCSVVLAAMQVVMTSNEPSAWLVNLCFNFSVLVIFFVFLVMCAIIGLVCSLFLCHLTLTISHQRELREKVNAT